MKVLVGRLEQLYCRLQEKFLGKYDIKQLKDRLLYGMSQHLCDSMQFLYKKDETSYEELLEASQEAEGEWTENKTAWVKNASASENEGLKALRDQISALANTISATNSPKKTGDKTKANGQSKQKKDNNVKSKLKGIKLDPTDLSGRGKNPSNALNVAVGDTWIESAHHKETKIGGV